MTAIFDKDDTNMVTIKKDVASAPNISEQYFGKINQESHDHPFKLDDNFISQYSGKSPNFGFNGLGELVYYRTYSRLKENGQKETFADMVQRVVEGCYEIQRRHCLRLHIPWNLVKAQSSAQEMFKRIWDFKFTPPGRGLWMMGTKFMWERGSASLNNCGYVSTDDLIESDPAEPFCFLMDMSMLGVGVGFDTKGAGKIQINKPSDTIRVYQVTDSREGWVDSIRHLIRSYTTTAEEGYIEFDYSQIRPAGSIIKGFGGKASGPGILIELHTIIRAHLEKRIGQKLSSVDIVDIMNYIGRCVVAGNVRRCLPKGTLVHLKRGLVPIEEVVVGDLVLTSDGYHVVSENVYQGVQRVVTINSQLGSFRCTSKHRVAVMNGIGKYEWKRAHQLKKDDRLIFVDAVIPGTDTIMPGYNNHSQSLVVPSLNTEVAWFIGAIHGDGYVYKGRQYKGRKHHGASITIAVNNDEYHDGISYKIKQGFNAFGFDNIKIQPSNDNSIRYRVVSVKLAEYLYSHVKQPKTPLNVPAFIRMSKPDIRAAYVAGLFDTDGSTKNRPTTLLVSVYRGFVRQVQAVYSSLGIPTKMTLRSEATDRAQAKWELSLVGDFAIKRFVEQVQPYSVNKLRAMVHASGNDFGYPAEWINEEVDYGNSWSPQQKQMTYNRALLCEIKTSNLIPVKVESVVDEGIDVETYDLSVPDRNEFVAEGLLVHNTAEIAFGEADDAAYAAMKNYKNTLLPEEVRPFEEVTGRLWGEALQKSKDNACPQGTKEDFAGTNIPEERLLPAIETWNAMNYMRWASNNSIFARVGMDYEDVSKQIAVNGEPGLIWLDNVRDYGRLVDGKQPGIDGRVLGANPCFSGSMRLLTANGYVRMDDLWLAGGCQEYNGLSDPLKQYGEQNIVNRQGVVKSTNVYRTGVNVDLYRVKLSDNSFIDATSSHQFIILDKKRVNKKIVCVEKRVKLSDLTIGQRVPLNQTSYFGSYHNPAYAELAGWCIGDGSLSSQKDGQTRAICSCYDSDIGEVMPKLQGLMVELYHAHNMSTNQKPAYVSWNRQQESFDHKEEQIGSCVLGRLLRNDGVKTGDKHRVPHSVWNGTKETVAAFIRGLASADGYVHITKNGTIGVRIKQSNEQLLQDCRLLLNQFGIASSVLYRHGCYERLMNNGKGGKKLYQCKAGWELIISGIKQVRLFLDSIGFIQNSKTIEARKWLMNHLGSNNSETGRYVTIESIEYHGKGDTYCLTEPDTNQVVVEGYEVGQCMEQSLESYELCVSGDTKLQLKDSVKSIESVIGKEVEVWNGDQWSVVTPRITGKNRELYRVHLSDGSYLDTTSNHAWSIRPVGKRIYRRLETSQLMPGDRVLGFALGQIAGKHVPYSFEMGYATGDGYLDLVDRPQHTRPMAVACGAKYKLKSLGMHGSWYKSQDKEGYSEPYNRINLQECMTAEQMKELRDKNKGLPSWVMEMDKESALLFIAGWIESDGTVVRQKNTDGYRIYGLEAKIRDLQLLLRRVGINHSTINFCHPAGQITNKGVRKHDLWYVQIASFEAGTIPTRVKRAIRIGNRVRPNPRYNNRAIDMAKKQYVVAVEKLPGLHTTYCLEEPINHMAVFGNAITYQCNLVETYPANHTDAEDYMRTLKFAYLYAKTVTLLPTHNPRTNQVTLRNRRIGLSQSGIIQAFAKFGRRAVLNDFCDAGYNEIRRWDSIYAEWLCVQRSIKVTSVKPSGTVSLVTGATPGIHHPEAATYWRRVRIAKDSILVQILAEAGYHIEPVISDPDRTVVVKFAINDPRVRPVNEVSIWEQTANAVDYQRYWADNQVSCTIKFKHHEKEDIKRVLETYEDQLKGISFLPMDDHGYAQAPYEPCTPEEVEEYNSRIKPADYSSYIMEAAGSYFCDGDKCEMPVPNK